MQLLIKNVVNYVDFDVTNMKAIPDATSSWKFEDVVLDGYFSAAFYGNGLKTVLDVNR